VKQNENHVRELRDENGRLHRQLSEKDFEMKHLKKKREEERLALAGKQCTISIASVTTLTSEYVLHCTWHLQNK